MRNNVQNTNKMLHKTYKFKCELRYQYIKLICHLNPFVTILPIINRILWLKRRLLEPFKWAQSQQRWTRNEPFYVTAHNQWGILPFMVSLLFLVRVLLQLIKIGMPDFMLTLFGKLLLIAFCVDYASYTDSFWGLLWGKSQRSGISGQKINLNTGID